MDGIDFRNNKTKCAKCHKNYTMSNCDICFNCFIGVVST